MAEDVTLTVGGQTIAGWNDIRITRGVEVASAAFTIAFTDRFPGLDQVQVKSGQPCVVKSNGELLVTGYVDQVAPGFGRDTHALQIVGRGKCGDLQDCSAEWPTAQISGASILDVATKLAAPYGIKVTQLGAAGPQIPQFNFMLGETPYEIIERIARSAAELAYEGPDGNLLLSPVGTTAHASGLEEGKNVERGKVVDRCDQRFSQYATYLTSIQNLGDVGASGNLLATAADPYVTRNRKHYFIAEAGFGGQNVSKARVAWEAARRAGRGTAVQVTVDSWRDAKGAIWTPNFLVPVNLPMLKMPSVQLVIGEVDLLIDDEGGTRADLILMPSSAFSPEPILLVPEFADVVGAS